MFESVNILNRDIPKTEKDLQREIADLNQRISELSSENQFLKNQISLKNGIREAAGLMTGLTELT